ncbi:MAG: hypothetical protein Q9224_006493 [Gallowayella concinna]
MFENFCVVALTSLAATVPLGLDAFSDNLNLPAASTKAIIYQNIKGWVPDLRRNMFQSKTIFNGSHSYTSVGERLSATFDSDSDTTLRLAREGHQYCCSFTTGVVVSNPFDSVLFLSDSNAFESAELSMVAVLMLSMGLPTIPLEAVAVLPH